MHASCLDDNQLAELAEGVTSAAAGIAVEDHIDRCARCRRILSELARRSSPVAGEAEARVFGRGAVLGRYVILEPLGAGGMGIVHVAFDPELDRKVAIKLLRSTAGDHDANLRLRREAQAIARLAHPNVIAVHDVGTVDEQDFMAMELVAGCTLDQWLRKEPRSLAAVLAVFAQAGRGLAAAHDAGLVHRDFKPTNVLVGDDGRVRVTDFGLARESNVEIRPVIAGGGRAAVTSVAGTPGYMSPEQLAGSASDVRADQFAFCVTLWEALAGERPFSAADAAIPPRIERVLRRGLSADPGGRYPRIHDLLDALTPPPARRRWLWGVAAAVLVASAAIVMRGQLDRSEPSSCEHADRKLAGIWDPVRKQAIRAAFMATGTAGAAEAWSRTATLLDAYTSDWVRVHEASCEARRPGDPSEALLDRRMACLTNRLGELRGITAMFEHADATVVERSAAAVRTLPPIATCSDTAVVTPPLPPRGPRRIQAAAASPPGSVSMVEVALPEAQIASNLNVVVIGWHTSSGTVTSVTDALGNVYSLAIGPIRGAALTQSIYYAPNINSGPNTITVALDDRVIGASVQVSEFAGLALANPVEGAAQSAGAASVVSTGEFAARASQSLIFASGMTPGGFAGLGSGYTLNAIATHSDQLSEYRITDGAGTYDAAAPFTSGPWVFQGVSFRAQVDAIAPIVSLTSPQHGQPVAVSTEMQLEATASDNLGITQVDMYVDWVLHCTVKVAPYRCAFTPERPGSYLIQARASDAAGNVGTSEINTLMVGAVAPWKNVGFAVQRGMFTAEFDAVPSLSDEDVVIGMSRAPAAAFTDLATIVRFGVKERIEVRNGPDYGALAPLRNEAGRSYHLRLVVNVPARKYSVYITPAGESEILLAQNVAFRDTQSTVTSLSTLVKCGDPGDTSISNFRVTPSK